MDIGTFFFKARGYIPVPFALGMLLMPYGYSMWAPAARDRAALFLIIGSGFFLVFLGEAVRIVSAAYSSPSTRTRNPGASFLFSGGPYAYVRNPMYIGNFLILAGMLIMSWSGFPWYTCACFMIFWFEYYLIIQTEEKALERDLGGEYKEYTRNVPRIIPALSPYGKGGRHTGYAQALKNEAHSIRTELICIALIFVRWYVVL